MPGPPHDAMGVELAEQLATWAGLWARRSELERLARSGARPGLRRIVLTGCGDCHAAAEYGAALAGLRTRYEVRALAAMELSRSSPYLLDPETLLVALSISGRTPRVLEAVRRARQAGSGVLAVTDDPDSPLGRECPDMFVLGTAPAESLHRSDYTDPEAARFTGYQRSAPGTKTYGAAELAVAMLALLWEEWAPSGRGSPRESIEAALKDLPATGEAAAQAGEAAAVLWKGTPRGAHATFCGTGLGFPSARFASYKLLELASPAACCELEEYCHTYYLTTEPHSPVAFLSHDADSLERAREIAPVVRGEIGGAALVLGPGADGAPGSGEVPLPSAPPEVAPLLLAHACAQLVRTTVRRWGVDTNRFRAGLQEEHYVRGSTRIIRDSRLLP